MNVIVNMFQKNKMKNYIKKFQIYWDYMHILKIKYKLNLMLLLENKRIINLKAKLLN
jgi:hypothetical protein